MSERVPQSANPLFRSQLSTLRQRLSEVSRSWAIDDYRACVRFHTRMLPGWMGVERCTIFILELESRKICSIFGTGLIERQIEPPLEGSIVGGVIRSGESRIENTLSFQSGFHVYAAELTGFKCRNMLCSPIRSLSGNGVIGAVQLLNKLGNNVFDFADLQQLEEVAHYLSISIESIVLNQEILRIAGYLDNEVERLTNISVRNTSLVAESQGMREVLDLVKIVSDTPINVLIQGENGTGKELIARMIHERGSRKANPFVPVNCACIPEALIESEFFGHEKGAFSGADTARKGRFEEALGGTLFLDEIAEMPLSTQPKFLRAIQEGEGTRLGSNKIKTYDVRLISATNKDLAAEVQKGAFRQGLFFRLFSVEILIPPLRQRQEDILPLAIHFLEETNKKFNKNVIGLSPELIDTFEKYPWPGNVRQLQKEIERLVALTQTGSVVEPGCCSRELVAFFSENKKQNERINEKSGLAMGDHVQRLEIDLIKRALKESGGNKTGAAQVLQITRQGLLKKIKRFGLQERF